MRRLRHGPKWEDDIKNSSLENEYTNKNTHDNGGNPQICRSQYYNQSSDFIESIRREETKGRKDACQWSLQHST